MKIDFSSKKIIFKAKMLADKDECSAICHDGTYIYSIRGNFSGNFIKDSEAFNVAESKWYQLPDDFGE